MKIRLKCGIEAEVDLVGLAMADAMCAERFSFVVLDSPVPEAIGRAYTPAGYISRHGRNAKQLIAAYEILAQNDDELYDLGL